MSQLIEDTLFELLSQVRKAESISPNDIAQAVFIKNRDNSEKPIDRANWQRELPKVRAVVVGLARQGRVELLRKGKPVEPDGLKGIYRLRLATKNE